MYISCMYQYCVAMCTCIVLMHTGFCTCVHMHVHTNLVCSALCSVFKKCHQKISSPRRDEVSSCFSSLWSSMGFCPTLPIAPQRDGGGLSNWSPASSALPHLHLALSILRISALILWVGRMSQPGSRSGVQSAAHGPISTSESEALSTPRAPPSPVLLE